MFPQSHQPKYFNQTAAPSTEPVTLAEAKKFMQVEHTDDDTEITDLITSAREVIERHTGIAMITQSWEMLMEHFPDEGRYRGRWIEITKRPVQTGTVVVKYYDLDDSINTYAASNYHVDSAGLITRIVLNETQIWPSDVRGVAGVKVEFDAGYGDNASDVPERMKTLIKRIVKRWYDGKNPTEKLLPLEMSLIRGDILLRI